MSLLLQPKQAFKVLRRYKDFVVLDATWFPSHAGRDARAEFNQKHIEGAIFFPLDSLCDPTASLPHMMSLDETFLSAQLGALGIHRKNRILLYDNSPLHTACRAQWMLKVAGHDSDKIFVLNGGLAAFEKEVGKKLAEGEPEIIPKNYKASIQPAFIKNLSQVKDSFVTQSAQFIDARPPVLFSGGTGGAALRGGHMPGSFNMPISVFFDEEGRWLPVKKIKRLFFEVSIDLEKPMICFCGSGITAGVLDFALDLIEQRSHALYDGSWSEWGAACLYPGERDLGERPVRNSLEKFSFSELS